MPSTTTIISTKGQVILPKSIRQSKHWATGTRLIVEDTPEGVVLRKAPAFTPTTADDVFSILRWTAGAKSIEEMDAAVLQEAARRDDRD
ncbi:AbrB/MazE/SpoVT family DNA-binding domain-containing protein [Paracoccus rhizosphaerae]|uniref:AbrB/MazE/SpoVT family DNA-binding domain-containing protein n=1 Tax=Paracoccus rhizosphaerae TaxID=1133347 RepID=A0ABV6CMF8_9RHOB|nr:AbrB/MazE/SpoVT family DNA-binding domain-containing protein [Paracoccus rhizosphaerae]